MPSTFELFVFIALILIIILLIVKDVMRSRQLDAAAVRVLTEVDRNKPALDSLEMVGRLVPPDVAAGLLQLANAAIGLLPAGDPKKALVVGADIFRKTTDSKPNDDFVPGTTPPTQPASGSALPGGGG